MLSAKAVVLSICPSLNHSRCLGIGNALSVDSAPHPQPQQRRGHGSNIDPAQSALWAVLQPSTHKFHRYVLTLHVTSFIYNALPHKLLFILQSLAQIAPSLQSLLSHRQLEFVPLLEPLFAYLICRSASSTWALNSRQVPGHRVSTWDNFLGNINKYMKKRLVE